MQETKTKKGWLARFTTLALAAVLALGLVACSAASNDDSSSSTESSSTATRQMDDALGTLTVNNESYRIAASSAAQWSAAILVGAQDKLVAMEDGYGSNEWLVKKFPALADLPVVFADNQMDAEALAATNPDLVMYSTRYGEDALSQLQELGIAYISDPNMGSDFSYLERIMEKIKYYGEAIGGTSVEVAEQFATAFQSTMDGISERTSSLTDDQKVTVLEVSSTDPLTIINGSSIQEEWMNLAGAVNVASEATGDVGTSGKLEVSLEQVLEWNPEYIICDSSSVRDTILSDESWASVQAVQNGKVYVMPSGLMSWGYHGPEEMLMMPFAAKVLQSELFADYDMEQLTRDFYSTYYGIDLDDEDLAHIFSLEDGQSVADIFS